MGVLSVKEKEKKVGGIIWLRIHASHEEKKKRKKKKVNIYSYFYICAIEFTYNFPEKNKNYLFGSFSLIQ